MFIRTNRHTSTQLKQIVQNVRQGKKIVQKVVVSLGGISIPPEIETAVLRAFEARVEGGVQPELEFDVRVKPLVELITARYKSRVPLKPPVRNEPALNDFESVDMRTVSHRNETLLGPFLPLESCWNELELGDFLRNNGFSFAQIAAVKTVIYNRLVEPLSEHALPAWLSTTSLPELLGAENLPNGDDGFYRAGDQLIGCQEALERHLACREQRLFGLSDTILLFDLTNTYFEGVCEGNPLAKRGRSKEKRTDCPLISIGMVLSREGFPICHQVFAGSLNDCKALVAAVSSLEKVSGRHGGIIVVDGGIATQQNLKWLSEHGYDYIVNGKRTTRQNFYEDFVGDGFIPVSGRPDKEPVYVKRLPRENGETVLLCRSDARKVKEDQIMSRCGKKMLAAFAARQKSFQKAIQSLDKKRQKPDKIKRIAPENLREQLDSLAKEQEKLTAKTQCAIGRLVEKFAAAARYYDLAIDMSTGSLTCKRKEEAYNQACELHGCYHLRSSRWDFTNDELWQIYISLSRAENGFRNLKGNLGLRPVFHQLDRRCKAHVFITVLAYHLQRCVEEHLATAGSHCSYTSMRRLLETNDYSTVMFKLADGRHVSIRRPGVPDSEQEAIYRIFGVKLSTLRCERHVSPAEEGAASQEVSESFLKNP